MKRKKLFVFIALLVSICVFALSGIRIFKLNSDYPQAQIVCAKNNETLIIDDVEVKKLSTEFIPYEKISNNKDLKFVMDSAENKEVNLVKATINIKNLTNHEVVFPLYDVSLASVSWSNGIDLEAFMFFNDNQSLKIQLKPNENVDVILPYSMSEIQFSNADWNTVESRKYNLVFSLYPYKRMIALN